jgi:beta-fructofuranosidase
LSEIDDDVKETRMTTLYRRSGAHEAPASDPIPLFHEGRFHVFHLSPPHDSLGEMAPYRCQCTQRHIVSDDLVNWDVLEPAIEPGPPGSIDENGCWTGSAIVKDGVFHLFYTAYDVDAENNQKISLATSTDGEHFEKRPDFPLLRPADYLEQIDYRDPYVFWNDDEQTYWMVLAARYIEGGPFHRRGVVVYRTSDDLWNWSDDKPLYSPWSIVCPECPEMFKLGDHWYLVFSHFGENAKTTYRVSDSCHGPWRVPEQVGLDGRRFYAAKSLAVGDRRIQWGNIYEREELSNRGRWTYAGDMALPRELTSRADGSLDVSLPHEVVESFSGTVPFTLESRMGEWSEDGGHLEVDATASFAYAFLRDEAQGATMLRAQLTLTDGNAVFGVLLKSTDDLDPSWELAFEPARSRVAITRYPRPLDPFWVSLNPEIDVPPMEVDGPNMIERPMAIARGTAIEVKVVVDGSLVEAFIDDRLALSYRIYDPENGKPFSTFGFFVEDGSLIVDDVRVLEEGH